MFGTLAHVFFPNSSNNHRPKLLHHLGITAVIIALLFIQVAQRTIHSRFPAVLGDSTNIQIEQLFQVTNKERQENGLSTLVTSSELTEAAYKKAQYMFVHDFWAHIAPDGTTPWVFIKDAGYEYVYAGENLARGFSTTNEVTTAWMNSPSHRENVLSPNYKEIGFAIMQGKLQGEETTLVVEMFGSRDNMPTTAKNAEIQVATPTVAPVAYQQVTPLPTSTPPAVQVRTEGSVAAVHSASFFDSRSLSRNMIYIVLGIFLFVLVIDMVIIERRQIVRLVGHNIDHVLFFLALLFLLFMIGRGVIL